MRFVYSPVGPADKPDATLAGPLTPILGLLLGLHELADAETHGITYHGDRTLLDRIGADVLPTATDTAAAQRGEVIP